MGIHKGTKLTDAPKTEVIRARTDAETIKKLERLCEVTGKTKSEIIRLGVDRLYTELVEPK